MRRILKNRKDLEEVLYKEAYDQIAVWKDGYWVDVGTGYAGEQDGDNPILFLQRHRLYDITKTQAKEIARKVNERLNNLNGWDAIHGLEITL